MIDTHCHILPGVDDGPEGMEEALAMARVAIADGIHTIVATPHLPPTGFAHHPWIAEQVALFQQALDREGLPLRVLPGAEVVAAPEVLEFLPGLPRLGAGAYLLLETPLLGLPTYLEELVFAIQLAGTRVALAHPERTQLIRAKPEVIRRLAERGCVLQLNASSLLGRHGRMTRRLALELLRDFPGCVVASDAHDALYRPPRLTPAAVAFRRRGGEARFREVVQTRPRELVGE